MIESKHEIIKLSKQHRYIYGYRKITALINRKFNQILNHKKFKDYAEIQFKL